MSIEQKLQYYIIPNQQPDDAYIFGDASFISFKIGKDRHTKDELPELKLEGFDQIFGPSTNNYTSEYIEKKNQIHFSFETITEKSQFVKAIAAYYKKKILHINFACPAEGREYWEPIITESFAGLDCS